MGLFDFLKKGRSDSSPASGAADKTGTRMSVFKGDLALLQDPDTTAKKGPVKADDSPPSDSVEAKDSADSVVYMSFAPTAKKSWICPECGTRNEECLNGCIVCGLKK